MQKMMTENYEKSDIALFCIDSVIAALDGMYKALMPKYGALPVVFRAVSLQTKELKIIFMINTTRFSPSRHFRRITRQARRFFLPLFMIGENNAEYIGAERITAQQIHQDEFRRR